MVPVVALTSVGTAASEEEERVTAQPPTPPATSKTTATPRITGRLLGASALTRTVVPFVGRGCIAPARRFACTAGNFMHDDWESSVRDSHLTSGIPAGRVSFVGPGR